VAPQVQAGRWALCSLTGAISKEHKVSDHFSEIGQVHETIRKSISAIKSSEEKLRDISTKLATISERITEFIDEPDNRKDFYELVGFRMSGYMDHSELDTLTKSLKAERGKLKASEQRLVALQQEADRRT